MAFEDLSDKMNTLLRDYPDHEIILAGDFNVHNIKWLKHSNGNSKEGFEVEFFSANYNFHQLIKEPTRVPQLVGERGYLLDLFLTTSPDKYTTEVLAPLGTSDHCVVTATFSLKSEPIVKLPPKRLIWHYNRAKWSEFNDFLRAFDWSISFRHKNANTAANIITNTILLGMKLFIPYSSKPISNIQNSTPWMNDICRSAIKEKEDAFKIYKSLRSDDSRQRYKSVRNRCKTVIKRQRFLHNQK